MHTNFYLITTVDITNHPRTSREDKILYGQKQNFLTVINTIGLRVNPTINFDPFITKNDVFGDNKAWQLNFTVEYEDALNLEMLCKDFMLVPFVTELNETANFDQPIFITKGEKINILFGIVDDK
jgi:hypothetical protein